MLLCSDLLFVQNQVNRPRFTPRELEDYLRETAKVKRANEIAEANYKARPFLSPRELVVMTRLAKRGRKINLVKQAKE